MEFGNKIRELRRKKSITQEQLAKALSVSPQCVSKWENHITMPDIQLLPELSVYFGVTIDELFDLTDDTRLERISNMLNSKRFLNESEFYETEKFLQEKSMAYPKEGKYDTLLAELYNHMADEYRSKAQSSAASALRIDPEEKWNHSLLRMAEQGSILDWNFSNHAKRIAYYQQFVKEHPGVERGYLSLLQELAADNRLEEAENILTGMGKSLDSVRIAVYWGIIAWKRGKQEEALKIWKGLLKENPEDWLAYASVADCMAHTARYDDAVEYYRKALLLQKKPRYTDSAICIAQIYEIQGKYEEAADAWKEVIAILREEHGVWEGEAIDGPMREITRLAAAQAAIKEERAKA